MTFIGNIARMPRAARPLASFELDGFPMGLNTAVPATQIKKTECSELVNFKINRGGQLETRRPLNKHTTTATGAITAHDQVNIGGTNRELIVDADKKVYYNNAGTPTRIGGTLLLETSDAFIIAFKGVALICDTGYLKYLDGIGATSLRLAYDAGTDGNQFDNVTGTNDTSTAVGNGTNTRVAVKFTSDTLPTGYTLPPVTITAYLTKTGTLTGNVTMTIRKVSDDSVIATKTFVDVSTLTGTADDYSATFAAGDITSEMASATAYYACLEYSGGDGANYVSLHSTTVGSGGTGYYYDGSWNAEATKTPLMKLSPGLPPKCSFGCVNDARPWLAGDPDNPGGVWYGNLGYLDFSTSSGGGFLSAIDANTSSYEVGAIKAIYGDLYIFGTTNQPYVSKLEGTSPSDWAFNKALYQKQSATKNTLVDTANDLWFASPDGVDTLSGVQTYGDLRTFSYSDPVSDRITSYLNASTALLGYDPNNGQVMMTMPTYHRTLVFHTKIPAILESGDFRYPISEYEFTRNIFTNNVSGTALVTSYRWNASANGTNEYYLTNSAGNDPSVSAEPDFLLLNGVVLTSGTVGSLADHEWDYADNDTLGYSTIYLRDNTGDPDDQSTIDIRSLLTPQTYTSFGGVFYIGGSDGFIYKIDTTKYRELDTDTIRFALRTIYSQARYGSLYIVKQQINIGSKAGGILYVNFYTNGAYATPTASFQYYLNMDDRLTVNDLLMQVQDAWFTLDPTYFNTYKDVEIEANAFQVGIDGILLSGYPLFINGIALKVDQLEED